jgi:small subunit ribosomal protein S7
MARRRRADKRKVRPDPKFGSIELASFINRVMIKGKLTTAQKIVYDALDDVEREAHRPGIDLFRQAVRNATPALEVRSRRVGGATYQVPREVRPERQNALAMRWLITSARSRTGRPMAQRLAQEILEASRGQGTAVKRREDLHRMAEANRAFVHYRW